jgi:NAD(P)-dependent dehydrogenase (short-subunit alcohol dehydrogenase family)
MAINRKELKDKVAIIGIGTSKVCYGIITTLLQQGATVVVPAQSSHHLKLLQQHLGGVNTKKLVTLLTDLPDYDKAVELAETVHEEYGPLDLVVFPFEYMSASENLSNISVAGWQRAVEENLAAYFISCRAGINAMKQRGEGIFVAIIDTDGLAKQAQNSMTDMLMAGQIRMARSFFEEVKNSSVRFHHLFINNLDSGTNGKPTAGEAISPEMIGRYIITLYKDDKQSSHSPFLFFIGKDFSDMHHYFNNN